MLLLPITIEALIKIGLLIACLMGGTSYLVLVERWIAAWIQDRRGPCRAGIPLTKIRLWGLGQPIADGVKFIFKEEFTPAHVDKFLYFLAPVIILTAALSVFAVIPFGSVLPFDFAGVYDAVAQWAGAEPLPEYAPQPTRLVAAPGLDVGMIYVFAVGSIAVYGAILGGWSSNNKYSFFGGLRSSAQLISYELPLGLGILGVVLLSGSLRLDVIIGQQAGSGVWNVLLQPLGFLVFFVAAFAESGRLPFDLVEAEQELVAGYHTEYSGMKLMMYLVAEFLHMIAAAFLMVILFFGGWHLWGLTGSGEEVTWLEAILRIVVLLGKIMGVILFFMIARWSWPRFRFDQLMSLAWKVMLPLGLVNVVAVAAWVEYGDRLAGWVGVPETAAMAVCGWILLIACWLVVTVSIPSTYDNRPLRVPATRGGQREGAPTP
ncbi:MAG: NADH-quinone oxidoreductase subunit H [Pirellulales bacterium]|nr:NADH-quinone oxidoreductase subunit H [Pirellulales bacterium]